MSFMDMCSEEIFILTGEDKAEFIEGVEVFKHVGRFTYQSDKNWPEVFRYIRKLQQVWSHIGKRIQREEAEPAVLAKFYCAMI